MANKYTKITRSIDYFKEFLDTNAEYYFDIDRHVTPRDGYAVLYKHPEQLFRMIGGIFNNLYDIQGLAPFYNKENTATDAEILSKLKGFFRQLQDYKVTIDDMADTLKVYNDVEAICSEMWFKTVSAVELAINLAEEDTLASKKIAEDHNYDIGIVVATPQEFRAVLAFIKVEGELRDVNNDSSIYIHGTFVKDDVVRKVILTQLPFMGMQAASVSSAKMIINYSPKYLVMVGHLAGNRDIVKLGDVIVSEVSLDYNQVAVKEKKNKDGISEPIIEYREINRPYVIDGALKTKIMSYNEKPGFLTGMKGNAPYQDRFTHPILIRAGKVVSGSSLLRSTQMFDLLKSSNASLHGLDMETYGLFYAAHNTTINLRPIPLSIKAVSDFGEHTMNPDPGTEARVAYACYNSARLLHELALNGDLS